MVGETVGVLVGATVATNQKWMGKPMTKKGAKQGVTLVL
eukprot:CAMPEP_0168799796 /NCGR_PEP_ID=MMETSP0725-20121227/18644_1 /TAXON_ID=265536 /ORGANISM="Amphiprora sp., Strain CCMP467" /LENGTH=38 /DNA_ID= /DNA_START= /DNA_END= /DNA_ORIENTATION=